MVETPLRFHGLFSNDFLCIESSLYLLDKADKNKLASLLLKDGPIRNS